MLSLRQLEILRAVMRLRTTVGAAAEVGLSQPAISNAIRATEATLGFSLFDRVGNRLVPTEEAIELHRCCEPLFLTLQGVRQQAADLRVGRTGRLRLSVTAELADTLLPEALARFVARHPKVKVAVEILGMSDMLDGLDAGATHLALGMALEERPGIEIETLAALDMMCACPPQSPLAALDVLTPADLEGCRLIAAPVGSAIHAGVAAAFRAESASFAPSIEVRFMNAALHLVEQGIGVAIVDPLTAASSRNIVVRPFRPALPVRYEAATLRDRAPARLAAAFLAEARAALAPHLSSARSHHAHHAPAT